MADVEIVWPTEDLQAISRAIRRAASEGGRDIKSALVQAGVYLARSAAASTTSAPKKRKALKNREASGRWNKNRYPYYREVWQGSMKSGKGPDTATKWYLKTKSDPKYQTIKNAGLAKKSWYWMIPGIRKNGSSNFAQEVEHRGRMFEYELEMSNKLPYIKHALKSKDGSLLIMSAFGKAARQLEKDTDRRLKGMQKQ